MSKLMKVTFPKSQKLRIIANDVQLYSTVGSYAKTIGTGWIVNATLAALLDLQAGGGTGIVRPFFDRQIQVDLLPRA